MDPISKIPGFNAGSSILSSGGGTFGDDPFLEVLVTQLKTQTPLDPVDNGSFMDQMSSFSTMKEQRELNNNLLELLNFQGAIARLQGLSEGSALLGKQVTYDIGDGLEHTGTAESVYVNEGGELRVIVDGEEVALTQITGVATTPAASN